MLVYSLDELKKFCSDTQGDEDISVVGIHVNGSARMIFINKEEVFKSMEFVFKYNEAEVDVSRVADSNYIIIRSVSYVK